MSAKCIAFAHHKGGTGKTTSCINVAGDLARRGKKVLVVDMDPQANATSGLRINHRYLSFSLYNALFDRCHQIGQVSMRDTILSTDIDNLHLVPAELDLAGILFSMGSASDATRVLDQALDEVRELYDYILIDTPPSYTFLLINAIIAADSIILPVETGYFSMESIETFAEILRDIEEKMGVRKGIDVVILSKFRESRLHALQRGLTEKIPALSRVMHTRDPMKEIDERLQMYLSVGMRFSGELFAVPYSKHIYEAQKKGLPVSHYSAGSDVGKAYEKITDRVIAKT